MSTICLTMIVKNEEAVIGRCLRNVWPLIDSWIIADTGSTDITLKLIQEQVSALPHKPGFVVSRPWVDFAHNRSEVLELARSPESVAAADYGLMLDADDTLIVPEGLVLPELTDDSYTVQFQMGGSTWRRAALFSNRLPWRYRGVVHEFPECPESKTQGSLPLTIECGNDGARRRDPDKYRKDAAALEEALKTEKDPMLRTRYTFYLAQSYKDAGDWIEAERNYMRRADMGGWTEEIYVSLLELAKISEKLSNQDTMIAYRRAAAVAPHRAEADYKIAFLLRQRQEYDAAYWIARQAMFRPVPTDGLFVDVWVYQYGLLDEFAVSAFHSGRYQDCVIACELLLTQNLGPDKQRYLENLIWAKKKLLGLG